MGPDVVNLEDLRRMVSTADPNHGIPVYLPGIPLSYLGCVPIWSYSAQYPVAAMSWLLDWRIVPFSVNTALTSHLKHAGYLSFLLYLILFYCDFVR